MFGRKAEKLLSTVESAVTILTGTMAKRRLLSILLILSLFVQMPLYAGTEMQLSGQESKTESETELNDTSEFINSYQPIDDFDTNSISESGPQAVAASLNLPEKYDSREKGYVTSVKNQGGYGTCWAFAAMSAAESSIIKEGLYSGKEELDLSEMHLAYSIYNRKNDPLGNTEGDKNTVVGKSWLDRGGNLFFAAMHLSQWSDPLSEDEAPYSEIPNSSKEYGQSAYKLENAVFVPNSVSEIKRYIMEYGSVSISYYSNASEFKSSDPYFTHSSYDSNLLSNHGVTIVGWDDTVSKEKFTGENKPPEDGVWIVKNSWGTSNTKLNPHDGYFYMSQSQYITNVVAFDYMKSDEYDCNYFYDGSIPWYYLSGSTVKAANIYGAKNGTNYIYEYIKGASVNVASNDTECEVQVYTNIKNASDPTSGTPMLKTPVKSYTEYKGVYTIPLGELIKIQNGTKFSVVVTLTSYSGNSYLYYAESSDYSWLKTEEHTEPNQSFFYKNNSWNDLHGYEGKYRCACVKALTVIDDLRTPINKEDITLEKLEYDYDGNECKPKATVVVDGKKLTESVDYEITYSNNLNAGTAVARVSALNSYRGEYEIPYKINTAELADNMVGQIGDQNYSGEYLKPDVTVKFGQNTLVKNSDYTIAYQQNLNVGTATVIVYGRKNYAGSAQATFKIVPCTLTDSMISNIEPQTYTGDCIKPNVTITQGTKTLVSGTDYTVSYGENVNLGTGTVEISGIGNYTGIVTKEFQIVEATQKYYNITASAQSGGSITPSGEVSVEVGESQTFNISADDGYLIDDVKVDGESIGAVSEYTFTSVDSAHTIEATFEKDIPVKVESIELSENEIILKEGESYTLSAEVNPEQAADKSLLWDSANADIVSVDNGVITALKAGNTVITVKSLDGSAVSVSCIVTVTAVSSEEDPTEPTSDEPSSDLSSEDQSNTSDNPTQPTSKTVPPTSGTAWMHPTSAPLTATTANGKSNAEQIMRQAKITKLTAKAKGKKKITVSWKKVNKAVGYHVQVSKKKNFKNKIVNKKSVKKAKITIKNKKIKSKKTYYVRVRAYATYKDANGTTQRVYSSWIKKVRKVKVK